MENPASVSVNLDKKPPVSVSTVILENNDSIVLTLLLDDPEVLAELRKHEEGPNRTAFARSALRIGILALKQAQGQVDVETLRSEGKQLVSEIHHELEKRTQEIDSAITSTLRTYFDPESGHFTERIQRLVKKDGDLERVLREHIGDTESSELARTLSKRVGTSSPLMRRLDPHNAEGIISSLETAAKEVLEKQKADILKEFSLDEEESALNRLIREVGRQNNEFKGNIEGHIKGAIREFSLDDKNSALSRLVKQVQDANARITDEFSLENNDSAINRLSAMLTDTKEAIEGSLSLDDEKSALSRLNRQLKDVVRDLQEKNEKFQQEMTSALASLVAKREEAQRSTRHGNDFEEQLCSLIQVEAQKAGDIFTSVGQRVGAIPKCKKGDGVLELGSEATAAGERIVIEAKEDASYSLEDARKEIEEARKNRVAEVGIFVFSRRNAPANLQPFMRVDKDIFIIWDCEDAVSDVYVRAALSVAKALVFRQASTRKKTDKDILSMESSLNAIQRHIGNLDEITTWTRTIQTNSEKILSQTAKLHNALEKEVDQLQECLGALKMGE
jgi:hypothetical protein